MDCLSCYLFKKHDDFDPNEGESTGLESQTDATDANTSDDDNDNGDRNDGEDDDEQTKLLKENTSKNSIQTQTPTPTPGLPIDCTQCSIYEENINELETLLKEQQEEEAVTIKRLKVRYNKLVDKYLDLERNSFDQMISDLKNKFKTNTKFALKRLNSTGTLQSTSSISSNISHYNNVGGSHERSQSLIYPNNRNDNNNQLSSINEDLKVDFDDQKVQQSTKEIMIELTHKNDELNKELIILNDNKKELEFNNNELNDRLRELEQKLSENNAQAEQKMNDINNKFNILQNINNKLNKQLYKMKIKMKIVNKNDKYNYTVVNIIDYELDGINIYLTDDQLNNYCANVIFIDAIDVILQSMDDKQLNSVQTIQINELQSKLEKQEETSIVKQKQITGLNTQISGFVKLCNEKNETIIKLKKDIEELNAILEQSQSKKRATMQKIKDNLSIVRMPSTGNSGINIIAAPIPAPLPGTVAPIPAPLPGTTAPAPAPAPLPGTAAPLPGAPVPAPPLLTMTSTDIASIPSAPPLTINLGSNDIATPLPPPLLGSAQGRASQMGFLQNRLSRHLSKKFAGSRHLGFSDHKSGSGNKKRGSHSYHLSMEIPTIQERSVRSGGGGGLLGIKKKQKIKPTIKMKAFHWKPLVDKRLGGTIWEDITKMEELIVNNHATSLFFGNNNTNNSNKDNDDAKDDEKNDNNDDNKCFRDYLTDKLKEKTADDDEIDEIDMFNEWLNENNYDTDNIRYDIFEIYELKAKKQLKDDEFSDSSFDTDVDDDEYGCNLSDYFDSNLLSLTVDELREYIKAYDDNRTNPHKYVLPTLQELFPQKKKQKKNDIKQKQKKFRKQLIEIIDPKRAKNVCIGLANFKMKNRDIKKAILQMNQDKIPHDKLINLIELVPKPEEITQILSINGLNENVKESNLGKCERFFYQFIRMDQIKERLESWEYKLSFNQDYNDNLSKVKLLENMCNVIKESKGFQQTLAVILATGNFINGGTKKGSKNGFALETLTKIGGYKTTDGGMSMLGYIYQFLRKVYPNSLKWIDEMNTLPEIIKTIETDELDKDINQMDKRLEKIKDLLALQSFQLSNTMRSLHAANPPQISVQSSSASNSDDDDVFIDEMDEFYASAIIKIDDLQVLFNDVINDIEELALFFGEKVKPSQFKAEKFFGIFNNFRKDFIFHKNKVIQFEEKKATEKRKNLAKKQRELDIKALKDKKKKEKEERKKRMKLLRAQRRKKKNKNNKNKDGNDSDIGNSDNDNDYGLKQKIQINDGNDDNKNDDNDKKHKKRHHRKHKKHHKKDGDNSITTNDDNNDDIKKEKKIKPVKSVGAMYLKALKKKQRRKKGKGKKGKKLKKQPSMFLDLTGQNITDDADIDESDIGGNNKSDGGILSSNNDNDDNDDGNKDNQNDIQQQQPPNKKRNSQSTNHSYSDIINQLNDDDDYIDGLLSTFDDMDD